MGSTSLARQLRVAAEKAIDGGQTRYAIAKGAGVPFKALSGWLANDRDIALSTASKIADYLNLTLRPIDQPTDAKAKLKAPAMPAVDWGKVEPKPKSRKRK